MTICSIICWTSLHWQTRPVCYPFPTHAPAWMSVTPSESFGLHLDPPVCSILPSSGGLALTLQRALSVLCAPVMHLITSATMQSPASMGPPCSHLQVWGGDVVSHHNRVRDILVQTCRWAYIGVQVEVSNNLTHDHSWLISCCLIRWWWQYAWNVLKLFPSTAIYSRAISHMPSCYCKVKKRNW